ncbi:hypothetical protein [Mycolicibacter heraklionensis]|uniref:hypothetical protein n=1 Tax=Mycolicibacter heraklionensis TaxID=512402 RepID=UPI000A502849|nr:hypothetical protein [Mycolicibacter heraklionensis]
MTELQTVAQLAQLAQRPIEAPQLTRVAPLACHPACAQCAADRREAEELHIERREELG